MNTKRKEIIIIGLALFAMFFGAGNVLLPPFLGRTSGDKFLLSSISFILAGVGLPMLALLATFKNEGDFFKLFEMAGPKFAYYSTILAFLAIGPMIAIPRTAATTIEMSLLPFFPNFPAFLGIIIYFLINLFFVLKKSDVLDNIGKFLTPILVLTLAILIIRSVFFPISAPIDTNVSYLMSSSFVEGYNTLDAIAAVIFSGVIWNSVLSKNIEKKDIFSVSLKGSIIAIFLLGIVYLGLIYVGAQTSGIAETENLGRAALLIYISKAFLGNYGSIVLALIVSFACLTTSIGLIAAGGEFFEKIFKGKISYNMSVIIIVVLSIIIGQLGLDTIVSIAVPILFVIYPTLMILIFSTFIKEKLPSTFAIKTTTYVTLILSIVSVTPKINSTISFLPFYNENFAWLIPAIIVFVISVVYDKNKN